MRGRLRATDASTLETSIPSRNYNTLIVRDIFHYFLIDLSDKMLHSHNHICQLS